MMKAKHSAASKPKRKAGRSPVITVDEWLAELERLASEELDSDGAFTVQEIIAQTEPRRCAQTVCKWIRAGILQSKIEACKKSITTIDGRTVLVPAYRFKP